MELFNHIEDLSKMASLYLRRIRLIEGNIANADTPGYSPKDITFKKILRKETLRLKTSDPRHIKATNGSSWTVQIFKESGYISGYDKNSVSIDIELSKLAESSLMYKTIMQIMKKEIAKLKLSIEGK